MPEVERGHDRRHRRGRSLVAADFQTRSRFSAMIGVMNDRSRKPENPALDRRKHRLGF
jgi:hypothetical protein